jgi:hypothetical protein
VAEILGWPRRNCMGKNWLKERKNWKHMYGLWSQIMLVPEEENLTGYV